MSLVDLIAIRRDGKPHTEEDLREIARYAAIDDEKNHYQLSAWLMAAYIHPLSRQETVWLTKAMAETGDRVNLEGLPHPWVDKHSTGGVGDKTTIAIMPILASCGLTIVKMSGPGLGITGGTIDKLSSIPGIRLDLTPEELKEQAGKIGLALTGQSPNLAPADKTLYKLRDTTATVASVPLIVSSILSKKIAGGAEKLVLDVKCGSGAFRKNMSEARELATELVAVAKECSLPTVATITDMDQPLGCSVGNAIEVREAFDLLQGLAPVRFRELVYALAAETLHFAGVCASEDEGLLLVERAIESGRAMKKADEWVLAQTEGRHNVESALLSLPKPAFTLAVMAEERGWVQRADAAQIGQAVIDLGGGRKQKSDTIDVSVGIELHAPVGSEVEKGQPLATIYAKNEADAEIAKIKVLEAIRVVGAKVEGIPVILESVR